MDHKFIAYHKQEDQPCIELFHGKFKGEYAWPRDFQMLQEAEATAEETFIDDNQDMPHSTLGHLGPCEFLSRTGAAQG